MYTVERLPNSPFQESVDDNEVCCQITKYVDNEVLYKSKWWAPPFLG